MIRKSAIIYLIFIFIFFLVDLEIGKGPALALLLAGPALSLPSMIVLIGIMGFKKTAVYVFLVVIIATLTGMIFGSLLF